MIARNPRVAETDFSDLIIAVSECNLRMKIGVKVNAYGRVARGFLKQKGTVKDC
jgi:hypothetical protein